MAAPWNGPDYVRPGPSQRGDSIKTFGFKWNAGKIVRTVRIASDESIEATAAAIAESARQKVPRLEGGLARSIISYSQIEGGKAVGYVVTGEGDEGRHYGAHVELGHRIYGRSRSKTGRSQVVGHREAQPFMRPALQDIRAARVAELKMLEKFNSLAASLRDAVPSPSSLPSGEPALA